MTARALLPHAAVWVRGGAALLALAALAGCGATSTTARSAGSGEVQASPAMAPTPAVDPLVGSLAEGWAVGELGIGAAPSAPPGFTQAGVRDAVRQVTGVLRAGSLDAAVVIGGELESLLAAEPGYGLDPGQFPDVLDGVGPDPGEFVVLATRFAPGSVTMLQPPRVRGAFTATTEPGAAGPELAVRWTGTLVYPLRDSDGRSGLVAVERELVWWFVQDYDYVADAVGYAYGARMRGVQVCTGPQRGHLLPVLLGPDELLPADVDGLVGEKASAGADSATTASC